MRRREFLELPAKSLGGLLLYTLAREPIRVQAQDGNRPGPAPLLHRGRSPRGRGGLRADLPRDDSGPGATEAGVVIYIDRQLAGPYGRDKYRYTKGPWVESLPEHGNQSKATPREIYREGIRLLEDFAALPAAEQDAKLHAIEKTPFFQLLRRHTLEGMFSDPLHGGNAGMIGWQLIGYPGPRMSYREEIGKNPGEPWRRKPVSLADSLGHPVVGWEEEKD